MATRRDQLHSYQFLTQRVISAFVMRETDPAQSPLRRGIGAVFAGVMIAVLVTAGFGVYGILTKVGSDTWKAEGSVVIEKETGASFVYLDGILHPTLNYASAMLAAGRPNPPVFRVAANSLADTARGTTVGIPGAPTSLPLAQKQVGLPWSVCATSGRNGSGDATYTTTLVVSKSPSGGRQLAEEAFLIKDAELGMTFLIWHGRRHLIQQSKLVVPALFGAVTPARAGTAWLNALPAGVDIAPIGIADRGHQSSAVRGRRIGDVLVAETGSGPQYYVVLDDGISPVTPLQQTIMRAKNPGEPISISVSEATSAPRSRRDLQPTGDAQPPAKLPTLVTPRNGEMVCAVTGDAKLSPTIWVGGDIAGMATAPRTSAITEDGVPLADRVLVPAGRVGVVRVLASPTAETGPYCVITDLGIRYPVPNAVTLALLGYDAAQAVGVPANLVSRIPAGPTLDPARARQPATAVQ